MSDTEENYFKYVLLYVDGFLVVLGHTKDILENIGYYFLFNAGSVGPPYLYLGETLIKVQLPNVVLACSDRKI